MGQDLGAEVDRLSREAKELASELGGGWRLEQGIMPVVVLTTVEANRLRERLAKAERLSFVVGKFNEDTSRLVQER